MMSKIFVTIALVASAISAPALAQPLGGGRGGWMQRDVTREQARQMADMMFQRFDANGDGILTRAEADQAAGQFGGRRRGGGVQQMIGQAFGDAQSLTLAQFEARALARFDTQDLNHDGTVTAAERQQAREQRAQAEPPAPSQPQVQPPQ